RTPRVGETHVRPPWAGVAAHGGRRYAPPLPHPEAQRMAETEREAACCGGWARGGGGRARDPFALPGTERRDARDRVMDVKHIRLEVAVDLEKRSIRGTAVHTVAALNDDTKAVT